MGDSGKTPCSLEGEVKEIRDMTMAHKIRLDNGTHAFKRVSDSVDKTNKRIDELDKRTAPKVPSTGKIIAITITVFMAAATALWGLAQNLSDRPTTNQMREVLHTHEGNGHTDLRQTVQNIRADQKAHRVILDRTATQQAQNAAKLDKLLMRTPDRPKTRRARRP